MHYYYFFSLKLVLILAVIVVVTTITAGASAASTTTTAVYGSLSTAVSRKQQFDLQNIAASAASSNNDNNIQVYFLTEKEQAIFVKEKCNNLINIYDGLQNDISLQQELYKWCAFNASTNDRTIFLDPNTPVQNVNVMKDILINNDDTSKKNNVVVLDEYDGIHGSFILLEKEQAKRISKIIIDLFVQNDIELIQSHALLISKTIYQAINNNNNDSFTYLQLHCRALDATLVHDENNNRNHLACPATTGYCCSVQSVDDDYTLLLSRHYILPYQTIQHDKLPSSYAGGEKDPFISTIKVETFPSTTSKPTPNFYDILHDHHHCTLDDACAKCLREKKGATCHHTCKHKCKCYCEKLCSVEIPKKRIAQEWIITPPILHKHPHRLIPKIIHQTYFEELHDTNKYPNMSRLVESFKQAGWEYRFYNDVDAIQFLKQHFPAPVVDAYQALIPGAFKADLFRYCVLLISGGIYADVDIQLESNLDISIPPDVGFMVPVDEPGKPVEKQMCLWNGLIAAAPGHPILAKAIETVVNQVRNRFTSVDVDATFCPNPELSVLHAYDTLFTAGPCLLGSTLNRVLGRNGQASHIPGEIHDLWNDKHKHRTMEGTNFVHGIDDNSSMIEHRIPGRTIILRQNKWDMGAHRFTFLEQNLVIAATDLPDSDDRKNAANNDKENEDEHQDATVTDEQHVHYSHAHAKTGIYGLEHLYVDQKRANEDIRIIVDMSLHSKKIQAVAS